VTAEIDEPFLRIGDAERDRAVDALRRAAGEGRLTDAEVADRADRARSCRTRGELATLLGDVLPAPAVADLVTGGVRTGPARGPGFAWDDPLVLMARWDDERRAGAWEVPPFIEANPVISSVRLDFTAAKPVSLLIDVVLVGGAGNLVVVVPEGWGVDTSRVTKGMGGIRNRVVAQALPGVPQVMIRGENKLGTLVVRYPNRLDGWRARRAVANENRTLERHQRALDRQQRALGR
jgi:hypothetical protein